jgi:hypothetical protein
MADDPTDLSEERSRRKPLSDLQKSLAVIADLRAGRPVSDQDSAFACDYVNVYTSAESVTEKRFEMAMLNVGFDLPTLRRVKEAYETLKTPDPEKAG